MNHANSTGTVTNWLASKASNLDFRGQSATCCQLHDLPSNLAAQVGAALDYAAMPRAQAADIVLEEACHRHDEQDCRNPIDN